jgi:hypothetical protein
MEHESGGNGSQAYQQRVEPKGEGQFTVHQMMNRSQAAAAWALQARQPMK